MNVREAVLIGADRPFGAAIAARLAAEGVHVRPDTQGEGALDALVVNAPIELQQVRFADITDGQFRAALEPQVYGVAEAVQAVSDRLVRSASIVLVGSRAHLGGWGGAHQMAAGAAMIGLSRSLALELADRGIRVNCLAPDFVGALWDTQEAHAQLADAVCYLAGPASALISGETILLDFGRSLRMTESASR